MTDDNNGTNLSYRIGNYIRSNPHLGEDEEKKLWAAAAVLDEWESVRDHDRPAVSDPDAPPSDTGVKTTAKTLEGVNVVMSPVTIEFDTASYTDAVVVLAKAARENARALGIIATKLVPPDVKIENNQVGISIRDAKGITVKDAAVTTSPEVA